MAKQRVDSRANGGRKANGKRKSRRHPNVYIETGKSASNGDGASAALYDGDDMLRGDEDEEDDDNQATGSKAFLLSLDEKKISRTRAETERIHRQELLRQKAEANAQSKKGKRKAAIDDAESDAESTDMEGASVGSSSMFEDDDDEEELDVASADEDVELGSDEEAAYMQRLHKRQKREDERAKRVSESQSKKKLPKRGQDGEWSSDEEDRSDEEEDEDGRVLYEPVEESEESEDEAGTKRMTNPKSTITTGSRFGLRSPYEICSQTKRSARVLLARDQIARLSTDIINDPETSLGLLKRLFVFAQPFVKSGEPNEEKKRANVDEAIRASAILSLCAVFVDILPGYRIRELTEQEKNERVNQDLARRREWEQGLVNVYSSYLELCEKVSRQSQTSGPLFTIALKAMCTLVVKATHFNFRTNLVRSLVSCLSRKTWDQASEEASQSLVLVLQQDRQGDASLEVVRLLNRMIKERQFRIDARVLAILTHLRLRDELEQGKRADMTTATATEATNNDVYNKKLKSKDIRKGLGEHLSKSQAKKRKEMREIAAEMKEAEAEVDQEARERHQTETLKLLFVLYFSIVKFEKVDDELLIATMKGLTLFAHRINVDFFRDLLAVLRLHVQKAKGDRQADEALSTEKATLALHCIVTALELLNGQGEALNVDLSDIVADLYQVMLFTDQFQLLLRALHLALVTAPVHAVPRERVASFVVRISICTLHATPEAALALVQTIHLLVRRFPALQALLNSDDRARNGHFDAVQDQLDGLRPLQAGYILWPLHVLRQSCHDDVRHRVELLLTEFS